MLGVSPEKNSKSIWNKKELENADIISTINFINKKKNFAHSNQLQMGHEILNSLNMKSLRKEWNDRNIEVMV